ncbi:MAG: pyrroline-5-carboxylate reductase [Betaproteobacteria bacterium]|nr:MAG: pyrroline-5-carboxylate reductase [Betaproteobacteria bacterium]
MKKICFVGGGNMASAIIVGLRKVAPSLDVHVVEPFAEARERMAAIGAVVYEVPARAGTENADAIVLATKPQTLKDACAQLAPCLNGELIVSIAAGTRIASIASWLGGKTNRIVRTMPNTPALVGQGITGVFAPASLSQNDIDTAMQLMRACGDVIRVDDEAMIDAVTAVSGSGPAYVFHWIESMIAAAKNVGFNDADARKLVLATLKGATTLAESSDESPATLRERVTSKGGTTAAALAVISERGVQQALIDAVAAARDRGQELGKA